jgi:pyridoxal phosphate enzyme (YggS family)
MTSLPNTIPHRITQLHHRIAAACERAGRSPDEVTLVAVSKKMPPERIREAYEAGLRHFGENRIQEAAAKIPDLDIDVTWHLIGHLQRNKARQAVELFQSIQSIDSERLAREVSRRAEECGRRLPVLIEVNTSGEESKFGVTPGEAPGLIELTRDLPRLDLQGLMTIGPWSEDPEDARPAFKLLRRLTEAERERRADPLFLPVLSMGMTDDFEVAIEEGATLIRVGRAIFGERPA